MDNLVDNLPCGVILLDEASLIAQINTTAARQLGYTPAELIEKPFNTIITVASRLFVQTHLYPLVNLHGQVNEIALTLLTRTGGRIPVLLNAIREPLADGWQINCVYMALSQRHLYEAELIQARKDAEQAQEQYRALAAELEERVKERTRELQVANTTLSYLNTDLKRSNENLQRFAYIASHDLQEPLRKIQSFADLLSSQYASQLGDGLDFLSRMTSAASRMSILIKDLLAFSRISTQQEDREPVALSQIIDDALDNLELSIQEAGAVIEIDSLPVIQGNKVQLGQLFQNLLSNALKFRRKDPLETPVTPIIRVQTCQLPIHALAPSVQPARLASVYHRIDITDNGIGFDQKYTDRIFQVFQRLHTRNEYEGTGIGLAICEKVVFNHGGAITADSQPGEGSTFSVYLPISPTESVVPN